MKKLLFAASAALLSMMSLGTQQAQSSTTAAPEGQTVKGTASTTKAPKQAQTPVAQPQQKRVSQTPYMPSMGGPVRYYGTTGPRKVKYGKSRWILLT